MAALGLDDRAEKLDELKKKELGRHVSLMRAGGSC
jgi:hypothetical protein